MKPWMRLVIAVSSQMAARLTGDPRDVALRDALYSALIPQSMSLRRYVKL